MHEGHRERMFKKLESDDDLSEHELLEILLFEAIPRRNTNPVAHDLLDSFGGFRQMFAASVGRLSSVSGMGETSAAFIKVIAQILVNCGCDFGEEDDYSADEFEDFFSLRYLDSDLGTIEIFKIEEDGTKGASKTFSDSEMARFSNMGKLISEFIIKNDAKQVIMSCNYGLERSSKPTEFDDLLVKSCFLTCSTSNVLLSDFYLIGYDGVYNYYSDKRIVKLSHELDKKKVFE